MEFTFSKRQPRRRRGLSFVEFVGCLVAMGGGIVLGSMYLGMDIQQVAVGLLEQSQVVDRGYFKPKANRSLENLAAETLADAAVQATPGQEPALAGQASGSTAEASHAERGAATRPYWDQLTASMIEEARNRRRGDEAPQKWELYDYLSQRRQGHETALEQLKQLETTSVDSRLLEHGTQVIDWHKSAIKQFEHAMSLVSDGTNTRLAGPLAKSWQTAATQLRMEEKLVFERHNAIAKYLNREYADQAPFVPAFQQ